MTPNLSGEDIAMKTIENPFYKANGECVEANLDTEKKYKVKYHG
ncbi:hypothetical protein AGMMS50255_4180 [Spirochaetia bacterium]|nr:hypothetical protein AGMMS50255_4180 [Spirochaetia bacterium]